MPEWWVILLVFLLLFGAKKLPELARGLGLGIKEFKKASKQIKDEVDKALLKISDSEDISYSSLVSKIFVKHILLLKQTHIMYDDAVKIKKWQY